MTGGEGVTVEKDSNGAITVKAGGGEYQLRAITVVAFEENDNGTVSLIFREVMALCTLPGGIVGQLDFGAETDAQGNLTAINIGTHKVPVEDCGDGGDGGVAF